MWSTLDQFYGSRQWSNFRRVVISERKPICWHCNKVFLPDESIIVHHKEELTLNNINDYNVSLNPDNCELVHHECHNEIHQRYGFNHYKQKVKERCVYIVYGPPLSGKTSYVRNNKKDNDLVVDMDSLYEAVTMLPRYHKPNDLLHNVFAIRKCLIDNIKTRYGGFNSAWIIGGFADRYERELLQRELGAELIILNPGKEEVIKRLEACDDYRINKKDKWLEYIESWYETFG